MKTHPLYIVNTGDVLDEVDRIVDEDIQRSHTRLGWLRWIGLIGPLLGLFGTVSYLAPILPHDDHLWCPSDYYYLMRSGGHSHTASVFSAPLLLTALGLLMALVFLPAHHVLQSKATVLLLKARNEIKTVFLRTRPFREIGRPLS